MKKIDTEGFSIRLDFLMREKGMTSRELAKRIGTNPETISEWIYERQQITRTSFISAICREFNVKAEWLLYGRITNEKISNDN